MPIYAYKCSSCGHAQDVLQKMSDPLLTECPECQQSTYVKQVTAAGFQLKGSGWYVTDFRDGGKGGASAADAKPAAGSTDTAAPAAGASQAPATAAPAASTGPAATPAAPAAPAAPTS